MGQGPEWQLERYRAWLALQVRQLQLDPRLQRRFDSSDLVQETLLRAHENLQQFRGLNEAELLRWLQEILAHALVDECRKAHAQKRDVDLEQSLQTVMADSAARLGEYLVAPGPTPGQEARRQEMLLQLAAALDQLPQDQRDAIIHHHLLQTPLAQIAQHMERTEKAIAGLLYRGKRRLRELLESVF